MSAHLMTGLLFTATVIDMRCVECSFKISDDRTWTSQKMMSGNRRFLESIFTEWRDIYKIASSIYPGTNFCGAGNVAQHGLDYGTSEETDKCCKEHRSCDTYIRAGETKYGLTNRAFDTVFGCDCHNNFMQCLHRVWTSETIAEHDKQTALDYWKIFFVFINPSCVVYEHPIGCVERTWFDMCNKYVKNVSKPKIWQLAPGLAIKMMENNHG